LLTIFVFSFYEREVANFDYSLKENLTDSTLFLILYFIFYFHHQTTKKNGRNGKRLLFPGCNAKHQDSKTAKLGNARTQRKAKKKERRKLSHYSRRNIVLVNAEKKTNTGQLKS